MRGILRWLSANPKIERQFKLPQAHGGFDAEHFHLLALAFGNGA